MVGARPKTIPSAVEQSHSSDASSFPTPREQVYSGRCKSPRSMVAVGDCEHLDINRSKIEKNEKSMSAALPRRSPAKKYIFSLANHIY